MTDLAVQVRLSAEDGGLVGQLRLTRQELDALSEAQAPAAAATRNAAEAADRSSRSAKAAAVGSREQAAGSKLLAAAQTELMRSIGGTAAATEQLSTSAAKASASEKGLETDLSRLRAQLDPAGEAARRAARDIDLLDTALRTGKVGQEEYNRLLLQSQRIGAGHAVSLGQQRVGYQQLGYQIGDVSQQLALGVNPAIVFGQQIGQVTQALQLMHGTGNRFIAFMAGPWGAVLTGGITVAALLGSTLLSTGEALEAAEIGSTGLAKAQGVLEAVMNLKRREY